MSLNLGTHLRNSVDITTLLVMHGICAPMKARTLFLIQLENVRKYTFNITFDMGGGALNQYISRPSHLPESRKARGTLQFGYHYKLDIIAAIQKNSTISRHSTYTRAYSPSDLQQSWHLGMTTGLKSFSL